MKVSHAKEDRVCFMPTCPHGNEYGPFGIALEDAQSWEAKRMPCAVLEFYSVCDCCDTLMHGDFNMLADGQTLCDSCYDGEELRESSSSYVK